MHVHEHSHQPNVLSILADTAGIAERLRRSRWVCRTHTLHEYLTTFNSYVRIPLVSPPGIAVGEYLQRNGIDW